MYLTSFGAAEGVTGSCHLLEIGDRRVLLDCGMFQGLRSDRERNDDGFDFDPSSIDLLIVSHAHLDHIGRIPLLFKEGFRGRIVSTRATFELARLSLMDAANLIMTEAQRANHKRKLGTERIEPLYTDEDVLDVLEIWREFVEFGQTTRVWDELTFTFHEAGHILGSAMVELQLREGDIQRSFVFSGDLGNLDKPIINDPSVAPTCDIALMESTYGDRDHRPFKDTIAELEYVVAETLGRGGNVVIPTFAMQRAQELLYVLYEAWKNDRIPGDAKIFLDSPMAIDATRIFERHPEQYDQHAVILKKNGETPFNFPALTYTRDTRDSIAINAVGGGAVILAGSGMVSGGRVLHHLRHNLSREQSSLVICGYQARGTTGRRIVEGAPFVKLHRESIPVNAQVHTINGFSAHAGQNELTNWAEETGASHIFLVHGEPEKKEELQRHLKKEMDVKSVSTLQYAKAIDLAALDVS